MGNGYNYIREIMAMNTDRTEPKPITHFTFIGDIAECADWKFNYASRFVRIVNHRLMCGWHVYNATPGDVVLKDGDLYCWTDIGWQNFTPGPCTRYDGPRPGEWPKKNPAVTYDIELKEEIMAKKNLFDEKELCLTFIGTTTTVICENATNEQLYIDGTWIKSKTGYMTMWNNRLYVFAPDGKWHDLTATNVKTVRSTPTNYSKIPYGYLLIKKVHYSGDKTIVMWEDGTKTIVTRGENEVFDPEKGLVMAIAKKAYGNKGNYYNRIKQWLPEIVEPIWTDEGLIPTPKDDIIELLADMTHRGATKAELVMAITYSQKVIDAERDSGIDLAKEAENYNIDLLRKKYQK